MEPCGDKVIEIGILSATVAAGLSDHSSVWCRDTGKLTELSC